MQTVTMDDICKEEPKSAIMHEGNFFIMDSEQLVSNPFQDLQLEAVSEAQKKASLTERLTSVKNNVCENHFAMEKDLLERQKTGALKKLHDHSSRLRYEVKLLDLDRQRHKVEVNKRLRPEHDYSYDELLVSNTEKRLGANICSFYLERRMRFPPRLRAVSDSATTPLVRQARQALRQHDTERTGSRSPRREQRATTAMTLSSSQAATSASRARPLNLLSRRSSRSAPPPQSWSAPATQREDSTRLPALGGRETSQQQQGGAGAGQRGRTAGQVKFRFQDPLQILVAKDQEGSSMLTRPHTYHAGMADGGRGLRQRRERDWDLEDDDKEGEEEDGPCPDFVDLRALLLCQGGEGVAVTTRPPSARPALPCSSSALRRSATLTPRITQDLLQQEHRQVQDKVDRFLQELSDGAPRHHSDSDSECERDIFSATAQPLRTAPPVPPGGVPVPAATTAVTTAAAKPSLSPAQSPAGLLDTQADCQRKSEDCRTPRMGKDGWKYIRGRALGGELRGTYRAEDMVLQTLTGLPLTHSPAAGIPLHTAGRALRHTPTFKMRKVVERLINERTKFQQHEIDEIKRLMEQGMDVHAAAAAFAIANATSDDSNNPPPGAPNQGLFFDMGALSRGSSPLGSVGSQDSPGTPGPQDPPGTPGPHDPPGTPGPQEAAQ